MDKAGKILNQLLSNLLERDQNSGGTEFAQFINKWEFIAGKRLYGHTKIIDLKNENLFIAVDHPGWLQLLRLEEKAILRKITKLFPVLKVKSVKIEVNEKYFEPGNIDEQRKSEKISPLPIDFDRNNETGEIEKIDNIQLKELMKRLYLSIVKKDEEG